MIALFTFLPSCCPGCGRQFAHNKYGREDFFAGASHSCPDCGLNYQYIGEADALDAAEAAGGDLKRMARP